MSKGRLLVIEGLDGSGKATQAKLLASHLAESGCKVMEITFPDYESDSSALVKMYLSGQFGDKPDDVNPYAASSSLGGEYLVRIQSMTNTSTLDTAASVDQCIRIIQAGADYVRLTAQGVREAENLGEIKRELVARGYTTPLVADIHFNPKAADA